MSVRVRFAPSPTGNLHVGGARTALFNYLFAKKNGGLFVLRIEDTDQDRNQEDSLLPLLEDLKWLGLDWDEGPEIQANDPSKEPDPNIINLSSKGPYAPYRQKDRLEIYKEQALKLINNNKAYYCFMSEEEEAQQKQKAKEKGIPFRVSSPYRDQDLALAQQKIAQGASFCIRFKTEERTKPYFLQDIIRGDLYFPSDSLGDFILIRTDGFPVYNFSCAIDDSLMKISHVLRGEEHLSNSVKQQLIQKALGLTVPQIGHLSIILDTNKKKLSKRLGAESLEYYKREGYLPLALINFLSLLGWNPKTTQEFFSKKELIEKFNLEGLNASSAVFDPVKLLWLNEQHIKKMSDGELSKALKDFSSSYPGHFKLGVPQTSGFEAKNASQADPKKNQALSESPLPGGAVWEKSITLLRSQFKTLKQALDLMALVFAESMELSPSAKEVLKDDKARSLIKNWLEFLQSLNKGFLEKEDLKAFQKSQAPLKGKDLFQPLRIALIGQTEGLEIKILLQLLNRKQMIAKAESLFK